MVHRTTGPKVPCVTSQDDSVMAPLEMACLLKAHYSTLLHTELTKGPCDPEEVDQIKMLFADAVDGGSNDARRIRTKWAAHGIIWKQDLV